MLKYFYNLYFEYEQNVGGKIFESSLNIGYFSSKKMTDEIVLALKDKSGFSDYPIECFKVQKTGVRFEYTLNNKTGVELYELSHEFETTDGESEWTIFGLFSSEKNAKAQQNIEQKKRKYAKATNGFNISKWKVDVDFEWKEGFNIIE